MMSGQLQKKTRPVFFLSFMTMKHMMVLAHRVLRLMNLNGNIFAFQSIYFHESKSRISSILWFSLSNRKNPVFIYKGTTTNMITLLLWNHIIGAWVMFWKRWNTVFNFQYLLLLLSNNGFKNKIDLKIIWSFSVMMKNLSPWYISIQYTKDNTGFIVICLYY